MEYIIFQHLSLILVMDMALKHIVVKIVGEKMSHSLLGIAEKIDANTFKLQLGYNNVRPKTFDKNETVIFTRVN